MPTYDYECPDCGYRFEAFQTMTAKAIRKCPSCGKRRVKRLIGSGLAPIFKGSGFYQTDYKPVSEPRSQENSPTEKPAESKTAAETTQTEKPAKTEPKATKPKK